jgi:uncharacterized protein YndB with AHSA1/START domain
MAKNFIQMNETFNAPVSTVFAELSDHEKMGKVLGAKVKRIKDGKGNVNGIGSVRRLTPVPLADFEETVTGFEPNKLIEYTVTKGSPIKNHLGRMVFSESNGKTHLHYTIQFDMKLGIPFTGFLLKTVLEKVISSGLHKLAKSYA